MQKQKQKQKILFIELKFGALVSEMAQKPKGRQCVDKKARHFAKVKVDKTTKPSWMNCNYIHRGAVVWDNTQKKWLWVQMLFCHRCHPKLFPEGLISNRMHESGWHNTLFSWMIYCKLFFLHLQRQTSIKKVVQLLFPFTSAVLQRQVSECRLTWMYWIHQFLKT